MITKKIALLITLSVVCTGCHKKSSDEPKYGASGVPDNPTVSVCQGSMSIKNTFSTINDNSSKVFTLATWEPRDCGDSLRVFLRANDLYSWYELFGTDNGASHYNLNGKTLTVYNKTGIIQEVYVQVTNY